MSSFNSRTEPTTAPPDPTKHVNYVQGMVLGVDDFTQEFAYFSGRDQWLARDLVGYGTVWGLRVHESTGDRGPEVIVDPGVAVSPRGQLIRVTPAQCAKLNDWLAIDKNKQELIRRLGSGNSVDLWVVLCYRDCPTDNVPIPGEPCRSEEDSMAPSRLADDFLLELRFDPPDQVEEDAIRSFVRWLHQIEITTEPSGFTSLADFLKAIRDAVATIASPPSPNFILDSPPVSIRIHPEDVCEYLRAAFRLWVTELRPLWRPAWLGMGRTCTGNLPAEEQPGGEECLLLAELQVPIVQELTGELKVDSAREITVDEERRPFLIHLRMLQEWLLCKCDHGGETGISPTNHSGLFNLGADDHPHYFNQARGDLRYALVSHVHAPGGGVTDHGALTGLVDDDHPQYLLANGGRSLTGNLSAANFRITNLAQGGAAGEALVFGQAAGGDLNGNYPNPVVAQLQTRPVSAAAPNPDAVLTWSGAAWEPRAIPHFPSLPFVTITRLRERIFEAWFNIDAPDNGEEIPALQPADLEVSMETDTAPSFRTRIAVVGIQRSRRNLFALTIERESELLRFTFNISAIRLSSGQTVLEHATNRGVRFMGHDGRRTATAFVRVVRE